jgi:hypothetical protein
MLINTIRYLLFSVAVCGFTTSLHAQETTFRTNGPDDYREGIHAFTHATVYKDYQTKVEDATLLIREGRVVSVVAAGAVPAGAIVHDMKGRYIYPSFIDLYTDYGINTPKPNKEEESVQNESNIKGAFGWNQAIHSDYEADKNFQVNESRAEELRKQGFGTVLTHRRDGIARGTGSLVTLLNDKESLLSTFI